MEATPKMIWTAALILANILTIHCQSRNDYQKQALDGFNNFTWQLFLQISSGDKNVFFSGLSAALAMGMVEVGATNETQQEIQKALGHPNLSETQVLSVYRNLMNNATSDNSNNTLSLANAAFIQNNFTVQPKYSNHLNQFFSAEVINLDFLNNGTEAVKVINSWVSNQTKGLIEKLYHRPLDRDTLLVLVNTVVFLGKWQIMFQKSQTFSAPFYGINGQVKVEMMNMHATLKAALDTNLNLSIVELFYVGNQTSMVLVVPNDKNANLSNVVKQLNVTYLDHILSKAITQKVDLSMPKFNLTGTYSLNTALKNIGINRVFGAGAQLRGISEERNLKVDQVTQEAVVKVDEEGTKAAAATGVSFSSYSLKTIPPLRVNANHPFLFFIRDVPSKLIYFLGQAVNPTKFS